MSEGFDRPFTASEKQSATFWMLLRGTEEGSASRELACMEGEQAMTLEWALNEGMCPEDRRDAYAHVGEFHFESPPWQQERFLGRVEVYLAHSNPLNLPSSPFAWTDAARNERTPLLRLLEQALGEEGWARIRQGDGIGRNMKLEAPLGIPIASDVYQVPLRTPTLPPASHTNCYILGETELTLVDPGSPYPEERERLDTLLGCLVENGRSLKRVVLTHHHQDHVGGANWVREKWGVPVASHPLTAELLKGRIDSIQTLQEGDWISGGGNSLFQALWTPGHAPGHLVLLDRERRWLVAGDMVAGASTIVIDPFEGNMGEYLRELERLRALQPRWVYPSHGYPIGGSHALFTRFIEHRLERERQIAACLGSTPQREEELVEQIYRDLHPLARPLAALQARAHLLKMGSEGRASERPEGWVAQA